MNKIITDFIIDSKELCFFCMDKTSPPQIIVGVNVSKPESNMVHSLQYLSRFLRMDMRKVFIGKGDIPPHLIAKVEMSRLKAHLCARCASLNETFSKLCHRLEKIEMEVLSSLENIRSELLRAEYSNEYQNLLNITDDAEDEWVSKLGILQVVRKEAIQKCSNTIQRRRPRVRVSHMTKTNITKMKQNHKLNSIQHIKSDICCPIKIERDENLTNRSFDDPDVDHEVDLDLGIEGGSPPSPTSWEEEAVAVVKSEHEIATSGTKVRHVNKWLSDSRISKNIESINLTGISSAPKARCRLCRNVFAKRFHAARHIKSVHLKEMNCRCPQCFKMFTCKSDLKKHMSIHSGLKPYHCDICTKQFRLVQHLKSHLLVHSRTRPTHTCQICGRVFSHKTSLSHHTRLKHSKQRG